MKWQLLLNLVLGIILGAFSVNIYNNHFSTEQKTIIIPRNRLLPNKTYRLRIFRRHWEIEVLEPD